MARVRFWTLRAADLGRVMISLRQLKHSVILGEQGLHTAIIHDLCRLLKSKESLKSKEEFLRDKLPLNEVIKNKQHSKSY